VRIIVDIHLVTDGRPTGTVRAVDQTKEHHFSGIWSSGPDQKRLYQPEPGHIDGKYPEEES
jgi:hypothetical protein